MSISIRNTSKITSISIMYNMTTTSILFISSKNSSGNTSIAHILVQTLTIFIINRNTSRETNIVCVFAKDNTICIFIIILNISTINTNTNKNIHIIHNVMSWSRDLLITWFRHVTTHMIYSYNLDTWPLTWSTHMISTRDLSGHQVNIKSSSIPTSASSFLCHDYIRVVHLSRLRYVYILVSQKDSSQIPVVVA